MSAPLPFTWDGEAMVPARGFARHADAAFVVGERYRLEVVEERSAVSHRHFFASVNEAWHNLDETDAERFPTPEHLRKFALISTGYADSRQFVASSKAEAIRLAVFIRPLDEYAVVKVDGPVVTQWTAQSQSVRAMGKTRFQESKTAVLEFIAGRIGVEPAQLERERAA